MPSRAGTSFLLQELAEKSVVEILCQCPLGLVPHFYWDSVSINRG